MGAIDPNSSSIVVSTTTSSESSTTASTPTGNAGAADTLVTSGVQDTTFSSASSVALADSPALSTPVTSTVFSFNSFLKAVLSAKDSFQDMLHSISHLDPTYAADYSLAIGESSRSLFALVDEIYQQYIGSDEILSAVLAAEDQINAAVDNLNSATAAYDAATESVNAAADSYNQALTDLAAAETSGDPAAIAKAQVAVDAAAVNYNSSVTAMNAAYANAVQATNDYNAAVVEYNNSVTSINAMITAQSSPLTPLQPIGDAPPVESRTAQPVPNPSDGTPASTVVYTPIEPLPQVIDEEVQAVLVKADASFVKAANSALKNSDLMKLLSNLFNNSATYTPIPVIALFVAGITANNSTEGGSRLRNTSAVSGSTALASISGLAKGASGISKSVGTALFRKTAVAIQIDQSETHAIAAKVGAFLALLIHGLGEKAGGANVRAALSPDQKEGGDLIAAGGAVTAVAFLEIVKSLLATSALSTALPTVLNGSSSLDPLTQELLPIVSQELALVALAAVGQGVGVGVDTAASAAIRANLSPSTDQAAFAPIQSNLLALEKENGTASIQASFAAFLGAQGTLSLGERQAIAALLFGGQTISTRGGVEALLSSFAAQTGSTLNPVEGSRAYVHFVQALSLQEELENALVGTAGPFAAADLADSVVSGLFGVHFGSDREEVIPGEGTPLTTIIEEQTKKVVEGSDQERQDRSVDSFEKGYSSVLQLSHFLENVLDPGQKLGRVIWSVMNEGMARDGFKRGKIDVDV